jgi:hypothetical protein
VCRIRTVQFTRFLNVRAPEKDWWDRKAREWSSINCANQMWRIAIADGWVILAKLTTASGEHADLIAHLQIAGLLRAPSLPAARRSAPAAQVQRSTHASATGF